MNSSESFAKTFTDLFSGALVSPVPKKPEELSMGHAMAIRDAIPALWQSLFAGQGQRLPADVELRLAKGEFYPEDARALRAGNWDYYAAQCDQMRQQIMDDASERRKQLERQEHEAAMARNRQWSEMTLLERMQASPVSEGSAAQARREWGISG